MDPREFLKLAERLTMLPGAAAAHHRCAIGRAYYAAYNVAAEFFENFGWPLAKSSQGHEQAVQLLQNSGDAELAEIGGRLGDLRVNRNRADYNMAKSAVDKVKVARAYVEVADDIIRRIADFLTDERRQSKALPNMEKQYALLYGRRSLAEGDDS